MDLGLIGPKTSKGRKIERTAKSAKQYRGLLAQEAAKKASEARNFGLGAGGMLMHTIHTRILIYTVHTRSWPVAVELGGESQPEPE